MVTTADRSVETLMDELTKSPRGDALAKLVHALAFSAYDERRSELQEGLVNATDRLGVDETGAETSAGNALRALRKGAAATVAERMLLGALLARGVALALPEDEKAAENVALTLGWVAANTPADALLALDAALGEKASDVWRAVAKLLTQHDETPSALLPRPSAIMFAAALGASASTVAVEQRDQLKKSLRDPRLLGLLGQSEALASAEPIVLSAEVMPTPRSFAVVFLLTATFILPLLAFLRLLGRYALHLRRPAELRVTESGVTVQSRFELLGKTLRETEIHIPRTNLARAAREIRYPRLATYVGIATLLLGSYVGLRLVIDGARAGAPEFLGIGFLILVAALIVDYALARIPSRSKGRCELHFQARRGRAIALTAVDPVLADRALAMIARPAKPGSVKNP